MSESLKLIETIDDLRYYLTQAMMIEHATVPPYLTALYSLKPETNLEAFHILRTVAVEEMLHLTLAANVFNAVGGNISGVLTNPGFVPTYPTFLPTGATDFQVNIAKFSTQTLDTFLKIERPNDEGDDGTLVGPRPNPPLITIPGMEDNVSFHTIGLFYAEIIRGIYHVYQEMGAEMFSGDAAKQVSSQYYYNGAGEIIQVSDLNSAIRAIQVIQEQGEGSRQDTIYDAERELCHYYRFQQLKLGQYYVIDKSDPLGSDLPDQPTGETFTVEWAEVYPILENAKTADFPEGSALHANAQEFQQVYSLFLAELETAFNGKPETLIPAVHNMFRIRELATQLIRNPIPGSNPVAHGAPIFKI